MPRWLQRKSSLQDQSLVQSSGDQPDTDIEKDEPIAGSSFGMPADSKETNQESPSNKNVSLYKGLLFSSLSSVFFSLSSVIVRYVQELSPAQLAVVRFSGILVFTLPVVTHSREAPFGPRKSRHLLILRGLVGATSLFLRFVAFQNLPIADASVIVFSIPVFVSVLARIFLKEPCGLFHAISVMLTMLGVILIMKVPLMLSESFDNYEIKRIYGVSAALGSTFFGASVYIVIRKMPSVHHSVIMFNFGWVAITETVILSFITGGFALAYCGLNQWLVILLGIFSFCGQNLLTLALKQEHAGPVAVVRAAVDIVLAFIWQVWFFDEIPDAYSISGAFLVSFCVVLISVRKWVMSQPEDSKSRKILHILTI